MSIQIETRGRRHYLIGNTFPLKDAIRSAGCKWDSEAKAWYSGKRETVDALVARVSAAPATGPASEGAPEREAPGESAVVAGRATYKGKSYYVAGRIERGRTQYDDRVTEVASRDGSRVMLHFRDGSRSFWAPTAEVQRSKRYGRPQTIGGITRFADKAKRLADEGRAPAVAGCSDCRALGHMCRQCEFDEFDN